MRADVAKRKDAAVFPAPEQHGSPHSISRRMAPGLSEEDSPAMYQRLVRKTGSSANAYPMDAT